MRATTDILAAVAAALGAIVWGTPPAAVFGAVKTFWLPDVEQASAELYLSTQRAAFIRYGADAFETRKEGAHMLVRRAIEFVVYVTDRVIGNRTVALSGDTSTPGVLWLKDAVVQALTGHLFDPATATNDTLLEPTRCELLLLSESDQPNSPGRLVVAVQFRAVGAYDTAPLGANWNG